MSRARKPLSKKLRYDIFKRDSFTCQYCGRSAPDVILEVDHIHPVAEGGDNDPLNLVTACRDCNRGKGKQPLTENDTIKKQKAELDAMNAHREQIEMVLQWKRELLEAEEKETKLINDLIISLTGFGTTESGKSTIRKCLKQFSFDEVYTATEIAFDRYYLTFEPTTEWKSNKNFSNALNKIGGICYNRRKQNGAL